MPTLTIAERFVAQCSPVIDTNYDTCGTITKASIAHLTPSDLDTMFKSGGLFADLDAWFYHSIEMKACGTRVYAWYDWIMANADRSMYTDAFRNAVRPGARAVKGPSLLMPFIMGRQETVINRDHWKMVNSIRVADYAATPTPGTAVGTMTDGPLTTTSGGVAVIRVQNRHNIPMDANWFRDNEVIHVFTLTNGIAQQGNWRVVDAAVDTSLTYIDLLVATENAGSSEPYYNVATTGASSKTGVIIPGVNNISDFEYWCQNLPNLDPRKMVPFWFQTMRHARCVDAEYLAVFKRLMTSNEAFKQFGDLDLAERNRQDEGVLLDPSLQSQKLIAVWTKIEPLPLVVSRPVPIVAGIVCFGIFHAFISRWLAPAWPEGIAARSLRMAALVFILSFAFWEFFTPFNQFGEPLPLIALELVFWAVIAAAEGFALSSVFEIRPDRSDGPGKTQGKNTIN